MLPEVVDVGRREDVLVPVGRADEQEHAAPGLHVDPLHPHWRPRHPQQHLRRRVEAQRLLHPVGHPRRVRQRLGGLLGVARPREPGVGEQLGRRLVAGHDEEEEERDHLVVGQALAVGLLLQERPGQVVVLGGGDGRPPPSRRSTRPKCSAASIPVGGTSSKPSSRCTRSRPGGGSRPVRGTPTSSEITSMGRRPAKSPTKSTVPPRPPLPGAPRTASDARLMSVTRRRREALAHDGAQTGVARRVLASNDMTRWHRTQGDRVEGHPVGIVVVVDVAKAASTSAWRVGEEVELLVAEDGRLGPSRA